MAIYIFSSSHKQERKSISEVDKEKGEKVFPLLFKSGLGQNPCSRLTGIKRLIQKQCFSKARSIWHVGSMQ